MRPPSRAIASTTTDPTEARLSLLRQLGATKKEAKERESAKGKQKRDGEGELTKFRF